MANAATNAAGRLMGDWNGSAGPEVDRTGVTLSVRLKVKIYGIWMVGYIGITVTSTRKPWARYILTPQVSFPEKFYPPYGIRKCVFNVFWGQKCVFNVPLMWLLVNL